MLMQQDAQAFAAGIARLIGDTFAGKNVVSLLLEDIDAKIDFRLRRRATAEHDK